jgi:hypothetical protein
LRDWYWEAVPDFTVKLYIIACCTYSKNTHKKYYIKNGEMVLQLKKLLRIVEHSL